MLLNKDTFKVNDSYLISAIHATSTATAKPCASAGCSLPAASTFSMTDTQPMKTKNIVPTSSATHGWIILSYLLWGLGEDSFFFSKVLSSSLSSSFSTSTDIVHHQVQWVTLWLCGRGTMHYDKRANLTCSTINHSYIPERLIYYQDYYEGRSSHILYNQVLGDNEKIWKVSTITVRYTHRHFQSRVRSMDFFSCYWFACQVCDNSLTLAVNAINPNGIIKQHTAASRWTLSML